MKKIHLGLRKLFGIKSQYNRGMFVDYGTQYGLGSSYQQPLIDFHVATQENPLKIGWFGGDPILESNGKYVYSIGVTFAEAKKNMALLSQANQSKGVLLKEARLKRVHHNVHGEHEYISEPEWTENVAAYITQSCHNGLSHAIGNLRYSKEVTKEEVNAAIRQITRKRFLDWIQISDEDIGNIVDSLFAEKIMSSHPESGFVDNKLFAA